MDLSFESGGRSYVSGCPHNLAKRPAIIPMFLFRRSSQLGEMSGVLATWVVGVVCLLAVRKT